MENEQMEFDFMIKGNQNFEGVTLGEDFAVTADATRLGSITLDKVLTGYHPKTVEYDQNHRNKEIILLLQVQFPETYKQIMDALRARDALVDNQW